MKHKKLTSKTCSIWEAFSSGDQDVCITVGGTSMTFHNGVGPGTGFWYEDVNFGKFISNAEAEEVFRAWQDYL
jgi:hypothetical protein